MAYVHVIACKKIVFFFFSSHEQANVKLIIEHLFLKISTMFLKFGARVLKSDSLVTSLQVNSLPFSNNLLSLSLLTCFFLKKKKLCIFGCSGSLLLHNGFL